MLSIIKNHIIQSFNGSYDNAVLKREMKKTLHHYCVSNVRKPLMICKSDLLVMLASCGIHPKDENSTLLDVFYDEGAGLVDADGDLSIEVFLRAFGDSLNNN